MPNQSFFETLPDFKTRSKIRSKLTNFWIFVHIYWLLLGGLLEWFAPPQLGSCFLPLGRRHSLRPSIFHREPFRATMDSSPFFKSYNIVLICIHIYYTREDSTWNLKMDQTGRLTIFLYNPVVFRFYVGPFPGVHVYQPPSWCSSFGPEKISSHTVPTMSCPFPDTTCLGRKHLCLQSTGRV